MNCRLVLLLTAWIAATAYAKRPRAFLNDDVFGSISEERDQGHSALVAIFVQCLGLGALSWIITSAVFVCLLRHPNPVRSARRKSRRPSEKLAQSVQSPRRVKSPSSKSPFHKQNSRFWGTKALLEHGRHLVPRHLRNLFGKGDSSPKRPNSPMKRPNLTVEVEGATGNKSIQKLSAIRSPNQNQMKLSPRPPLSPLTPGHHQAKLSPRPRSASPGANEKSSLSSRAHLGLSSPNRLVISSDLQSKVARRGPASRSFLLFGFTYLCICMN